MSIKVGRLGSCSRGEGDLTELDPTELDLTELDPTVEVEELSSNFSPVLGRRFGVEDFKKISSNFKYSWKIF